ncbi:MAG: putative nicotinate phosphoribosyltransferase [Haloplasmataceae bacterium]|jgi:nicotinate phosphoribosyltransferase|nr:putative nicotinate phosphoribosyltransferase [Haloplasmataceae bacterium]
MDYKRNLTLLTDFYEITMANGYFTNNFKDKIAYFDMFYRKNPDNAGFAIMAGIEQVIEYIQNLKFEKDDIEYLRSKKLFNEEFLAYLGSFKFTCDIWAVEEGTPIFPGEPILSVRGPVIEAQFIETSILLTINHQSLIATKANRIVRAAKGNTVMEFGARRAQGYDGAFYGARAAFIGGCMGTSCTLTDKIYGVPAMGTMAHSWIQMFDSELESFKAYASTYPHSCTLLVDTYNVLKQGVPNAIKTFDEVLKPLGARPAGIRIDSGDITYLSKAARIMLDDAGYSDCKIVASNSLDEYLISDLMAQGAKIDSFGVGERLITARSEPIFGGVYKLVAIESNNVITPKIKLSENVAKITNPGFKQLYRLFDRDTNKAIADVVTLHEEEINENEPYEIFDPEYTWKRKTIENFYAKKLLVKIFDKGKCVYISPNINKIKQYCEVQIKTLWEEILRFENPHKYYVDLSYKLWELKRELIETHRK